MSAEPAIVVSRLTRDYGGVRALDSVSLTVPRGQWVTIMGPSGSGKTTLLNMLDGLDRPTSGEVRVFGTNLGVLTPDDAAVFRREHIGLVFQQFHLLPYLTALENVLLAQYYHSLVSEDEARAALAAVDLSDRAQHLPSELSGGEQQRVCIARALINDPDLILADEPTANLDAANEQKVLDLLRALHRLGKTIVVATHDQALADCGEHTIWLDHGQVSPDEAFPPVMPLDLQSSER